VSYTCGCKEYEPVLQCLLSAFTIFGLDSWKSSADGWLSETPGGFDDFDI
jgi:hypothetical protein